MGYEPISRIRPVPPAPSLLTAARPLPDGINWSTGVAWSTSCQRSYNWRSCPDLIQFEDPAHIARGEGEEMEDPQYVSPYKATPSDNAVVHSMPFTIYTPYFCAGFPPSMADAEQYMRDLTEIHTPAGVAAALWMGTGYDPDDTEQPTLRRSAVDVSADDPYDLDDGIAALLTHYQLCTGGSGGAIIHMPGALATSALGGGNGGARVMWPEGNNYRGPHGALVVPGPGYPEGSSADGANGHGPLVDPGPPEVYAGNSADTSWVYVTGPVEYAVGAVRMFPENEAERHVRLQNYTGFFGEREAIVRFDPCCVYAVEVVNPAPLAEVS